MVKKETLAEKVRRLRLTAQLSQQELAVKLECHLSRITRIEQGVTLNPDSLFLFSLAEALGCDVNQLRPEE